MSAQIVHAAGESALSPIPVGTNAVVLEVPNEAALHILARKLQLKGIQHVLIREVDPPYTAQATAIGIVPLQDRTQVRKILQKIPLLGKDLCANSLLKASEMKTEN